MGDIGERLSGIALPELTRRVLDEFVHAAASALNGDLRSIILYGSAAEGRVRATSDVNMLLVLSRFERDKIDGLRQPLRTAHAACRLSVMLLLESEIPAAVDAFADKFADIVRRRKVLYGDDPFVTVTIPRARIVMRLQQVLLNLALRLRETYVSRGLREEQLALVVADAAGPLRAAAATLLGLEGAGSVAPKEALERIVRSLDGCFADLSVRLSTARETRALAPGMAATTVLEVAELAQALCARAAQLE